MDQSIEFSWCILPIEDWIEQYPSRIKLPSKQHAELREKVNKLEEKHNKQNTFGGSIKYYLVYSPALENPKKGLDTLESQWASITLAHVTQNVQARTQRSTPTSASAAPWSRNWIWCRSWYKRNYGCKCGSVWNISPDLLPTETQWKKTLEMHTIWEIWLNSPSWKLIFTLFPRSHEYLSVPLDPQKQEVRTPLGVEPQRLVSRWLSVQVRLRGRWVHQRRRRRLTFMRRPPGRGPR